MYQFKVNDEVVGYSATPLYIKKLDNGNYAPCSYEEAEGVAVHSKPYSLEGKAALDDRPVVTFEEVQDTQFFADTLTANQENTTYVQALNTVGVETEEVTDNAE